MQQKQKNSHNQEGLNRKSVSSIPASSFPWLLPLLSLPYSSLSPQSTGRLQSPKETEEGTELKEGKAFAASDPRFERAASFMTFVACMGAGRFESESELGVLIQIYGCCLQWANSVRKCVNVVV